jgi:hypothetical protein
VKKKLFYVCNPKTELMHYAPGARTLCGILIPTTWKYARTKAARFRAMGMGHWCRRCTLKYVDLFTAK